MRFSRGERPEETFFAFRGFSSGWKKRTMAGSLPHSFLSAVAKQQGYQCWDRKNPTYIQFAFFPLNIKADKKKNAAPDNFFRNRQVKSIAETKSGKQHIQTEGQKLHHNVFVHNASLKLRRHILRQNENLLQEFNKDALRKAGGRQYGKDGA